MALPNEAPPAEPIPFPFSEPPTLYDLAPEHRELQARGSVGQIRMPDGKTAWLVTGHAACRQMFTDPRFSRAAARGPDVPNIGVMALAESSIIGMDPPEHTRIRKLVASAFTARRVEALRPRVAKLIDELIDRMETLPRPVDLVENFSLPLPVQVICELLGVPPQDRHRFHVWSDTVMGNLQQDPDEIMAAFGQLRSYLAGLIAAKRAEPGDDLMTALIAARDRDDKLSEDELVMLGISLLIAGHETTANQINMFVLTLLRHPDQLAWLHANPEAVPCAVEELTRFAQLAPGGVGIPRVTTEEVELGGVRLPAGAAVMPSAAMNRDPRVFDQPDRLDLSRTDNPHLSFGAGIHHCLGAQLARMELQEALRGLLRRLPGLRVTVPDSELRFKSGMILRSLEALPVTW
jgi:cytochrome P450